MKAIVTYMYTIEDYYYNNLPDDIEYYDYDLEEEHYNKCYEQNQLDKEISELIDERSWNDSFVIVKLHRIAVEARQKKISQLTIIKFFCEYKINDAQQVWFWYYYYSQFN